MRFIAIALGFFALSLFNTAGAEQVRSVFKGNVAMIARTGAIQRMTFGLRPDQTQSIYNMTQGRVNFGDVFYVDHARENLNSFSGHLTYMGTVYPNVPPPAQTQTAASFSPDPEMAKQWWIEQTGVPAAWTMASGLGVTIADCDAGFYHDESDLNANMLLNYRYDLSDKDDPFTVNDGSFTSHGTSVTAIIAGVANGVGTNGIAYNSKIVPLQNYNYDDSDDLDKEEATAQCILHAIKTPGVNIIVLENQTMNGSSETFIGTRDAVRLAIQSGITVVGAGGNYSVELLEEQKDDTGSIIVGALTPDDRAESFTNFGPRLTVGAYGEQLHTLSGPNGRFEDFGGTSGATPQVAATVALMKEINPFLTPPQAREILRDTRELTAANEMAGGKLRVDLAVAKAQKIAPLIAEWNQSFIFRTQLSAILNGH